MRNQNAIRRSRHSSPAPSLASPQPSSWISSSNSPLQARRPSEKQIKLAHGRIRLADRPRTGPARATSRPTGRLHRNPRPQRSPKPAGKTSGSQDAEEDSRPGRPLHLRHAHGRRLRSLRRNPSRGHHWRRHRVRHPPLPQRRRSRRPCSPTRSFTRRCSSPSTTSNTGPPTSSTEAPSNSSAASSAASFRPCSALLQPRVAIACLLESNTA